MQNTKQRNVSKTDEISCGITSRKPKGSRIQGKQMES